METGYRTSTILCMPVKYEGVIVAVAQILNKRTADVFTFDDEETFEAFATFAGVCIRSHQLFHKAVYEKRRNDVFITILTKLSNTDIRDMDSVAQTVIDNITELLHADRCTLFMVDKEANDLVSKIMTNSGAMEIRVPIGAGIAGHVALHGGTLNIKDAYADSRFSPETDRRMGYTTRTILAMAIRDHAGQIVAVTQVINKLQGCFTAEDEDMLSYFSMFAGIALSNARLYDFVLRSGNQALELFQATAEQQPRRLSTNVGPHFYGMVPAPEELEEYMKLSELVTAEMEADLLTSRFNVHQYALSTPHHRFVVPLICRLFDMMGFTEQFSINKETMFKFLICAKKKYRKVPYHNITHAFDVAQTVCVYLRLLQPAGLLTDLERFTLLVSAVLHDIDHMGLNNSFHFRAETPLGVLSAASGAKSVLEVHHCSLSIELLSIPSCNILEGMADAEQKEAFKGLIYNILATDMARHKEFCDRFREMVQNGFNREDGEHRKLVAAMLLKCADISNVTKPFEISRMWGMAMTEEFLFQGDTERTVGLGVTPSFNRQEKVALAQSQLGFINNVVIPMMDTVLPLFSALESFDQTLKSNRDRWDDMLNRQNSFVETPQTSATEKDFEKV
eukprot:TRINITY_DN8857_c0_g1_i2.p1 TRINITY_DN8857_c0_g1~~TRINITY_DN8857_c0_g1_i2.p1  ORF type:complete len:621 (+),score=275.17 TRINITY_DN8857_c0_g1_i2:65-1927(+)